MNFGEPIDARIPWVRAIHDLDEARAVSCAGPRMRALRVAGERLGDDLREGGRVASVRALPLTTLPYPTKYAFNGAVPLPIPYVSMLHRALLVQVRAEGGVKNVLFNPTDVSASRATPFFAALKRKYEWVPEHMLRTDFGTVEEQLEKIGLTRADIDLVAFDHFHTQDLRPLLGTLGLGGAPARFPNAFLLAPRREWEDWDDLHPMQRPWFVPEGKAEVDTQRVVFTEGDLSLGEGCLLLRTPGHTSGNQTLFAYDEEGVFGSSESGTSADSYSPRESRIPGLRKQAQELGLDVILNSNTPELAVDQYNSMMLERAIVDRVKGAPAFFQMIPSSEVTPSGLAPGILPSMVFGARATGSVVARG